MAADATPASHRVLYLPDLLFLVLAHLPPRDLLLVQRVSSAFRHTVRGFPILQRHLFLSPEHPSVPSRQPHGCPRNNSLLRLAFSHHHYPTVTLKIRHDAPTADDLAVGRAGAETREWSVNLSFPNHGGRNSMTVGARGMEASWRRMFLSQPPVERLHLVRRLAKSTEPVIVREGGIRMGDFVNAVLDGRIGPAMGWISFDSDWHFEGVLEVEA